MVRIFPSLPTGTVTLSWVFVLLFAKSFLKRNKVRKKINKLFAGLEPIHTVKNCDLDLENAALGQQGLVHSFLQYEPPSRQITYITTTAKTVRDKKNNCIQSIPYLCSGLAKILCGIPCSLRSWKRRRNSLYDILSLDGSTPHLQAKNCIRLMTRDAPFFASLNCTCTQFSLHFGRTKTGRENPTISS